MLSHAVALNIFKAAKLSDFNVTLNYIYYPHISYEPLIWRL
jgi:hypothetical protein